MPLAMPDFNYVLHTLQRNVRRRNAAGNAGQSTKVLKNKPTRRRQLLLLRFMVTSRLFTQTKQKGYFSLSVNQTSNFSLT
jgi:hypothetical protein